MKLKFVEEIKVGHNSFCMSVKDKKCVLLDTGKIHENTGEVLHDAGCSGVIDRRKFVNQENKSDSMDYLITIEQLLKEVAIAETKVNMSYFMRVTPCIC